MAVSISNTIVVHDDRSLANLSGLKTVNSANLIGSGDISGYHTANLGVIVTSSGTSASLSGLTLTGYAFLRLVFQGVSHNGGAADSRHILVGTSTSDDQRIKDNDDNASDAYGFYLVSLLDGTWMASVGSGTIVLYAGKGPITTASTTVSVALDANSFDGGTILVQGLRV